MDINVRIAGQAGQGVQTVGNLLVGALANKGLHVFATQSYMSRIRGGLNWFDIRVADRELFSGQENVEMPTLEKYSMVCHAAGAEPHTVCAYSGTDLSQVVGITQADSLPERSYGWIQLCGEARVRISGQTRAAYADFRPNGAKLQPSKPSAEREQKRRERLPADVRDDEALAHEKLLRLSQLPPLLIEVGPYCKLLREARDVFVDGHFYACVAMCGISFERFQRDKAKPCGAARKHKIWQVRKMLHNNKVLKPKTLALCKKMADLRNDYAHGHGLKPKKDALKALGWLHRFISNETNLMQDYVIKDGMLHRKQGCPT